MLWVGIAGRDGAMAAMAAMKVKVGVSNREILHIVTKRTVELSHGFGGEG